MASSSSSPDLAEDFEDLFENAPCGYLVMGSQGTITRLNATLAHWLGVTAADLVGSRLRDLLTTPGRITYETNLAPLLRLQDGFEEVALDLTSAKGGKLPVLVNAAGRRDADGGLISVRLTIFRAADRRNYERDLQGREAAAVRNLADEKATSELREQFIAVLGHDLRNPLASVLGAARLLRREGQSDKALKVLDMMESSVDRMAALIDDVMDFARGQLGGGISLNRAASRLDLVLGQVAAELETANPSRTIVTDIHLPAEIRVDEGRIAQLVSNLLGNALTHGDPRQAVRLDALVDRGDLVLSVANAGEPIPQTAMERLFQPFFRGEVRPSQQGLGLGLHIASEIAKAHGGTLTVQSDAQETRFTLRAPLDA